MAYCKYGSGVQSFGNSIPAGLQVTSGRCYPNIINAVIGGALENRAVGGYTLRSITQTGYLYHPIGSRSRLVTWDGPINDLMVFGSQALVKLKPSLDSFLASAFASQVYPASNASVSKVGGWTSLGNTWGGKAVPAGGSGLYTSDVNASMSLAFTGDRICVLSYLTETTNPTPYRDLNISIDGGPIQVFQIQGKASPGEITCAAGIVLRGLGFGSHTITVTPTSAGQHTVIDSFIVPSPSSFAPVLLGHSEYMSNWSPPPAYGANNTKAITDQANAIINSVASEWSADGFPVESVDVNWNYDPLTQTNADGIHRNDFGHAVMATNFIRKINVVA